MDAWVIETTFFFFFVGVGVPSSNKKKTQLCWVHPVVVDKNPVTIQGWIRLSCDLACLMWQQQQPKQELCIRGNHDIIFWILLVDVAITITNSLKFTSFKCFSFLNMPDFPSVMFIYWRFDHIRMAQHDLSALNSTWFVHNIFIVHISSPKQCHFVSSKRCPMLSV